MISKINHINYPSDKSEIYCREKNKIIKLDTKGSFWETCRNCPLFSGDYQGMGVECTWEDDDNTNGYVSNPSKELLRVSKLIDRGQIPNYNKEEI